MKLEMKAMSDAESRRQAQQHALVAEAAARSRVERKMNDLVEHIVNLDSKIEERMSKVDRFSYERTLDTQEAQRLAVRLACEKSQLENAMGKMRSQLSSTSSVVLELPVDRRHTTDPKLKELFDGVDPKAEGRISLPSVKRTIEKKLPPPKNPYERRVDNRPRMVTSSSAPTLFSRKQQNAMSKYEQCVAAFKKADIDGSGTISKRELIAVLKIVGLKDMKNALDLFHGFDENGDGELDFDEFTYIAKTVLT